MITLYRIIKKIFSVLTKKQKGFLGLLLILMIVGGFLESLSISVILPLVQAIMDKTSWNEPWYASQICSIFNIETQKQYIEVLIILLIIVFLIKNIYLLIEYYIQFSYLADGRYKMQTDLMRTYFAKPYNFFLNANLGEIVRIMQSDSNDAFILLNHFLTICTDGIICIILGITIFMMSPIIALELAIILILEIVVIGLIVKPMLKRVGNRRRSESASANKWMLQSIHGIKSIKVSRKEAFFYNYFCKHTKTTVDAERKNQTVGILPRVIIEAVTVIAVLAIMLIAVVQGKDISLLIPQLSAFVIASLKLLPGANRISAAINAIPFYEGGLDNTINIINGDDTYINKDYSTKEQIVSKNQLHNIEVRDLTFRYKTNEKEILKSINVNFKLGNSIGIIGPSGSGKTTFIDIILGLLNPECGGVYFNDLSINENMSEWLSHVAYIPQQIFLMDDTIKANIVFGSEYNEEKIWQVLREAQLEEVVKAMPNSLDTTVGDQGIRLSGGQRQRIGIARALYSNPDILFFDEATSALDTETENAIMETINSLKGKKTLFIIAHRISTLKKCDVIYKIENGSIKETNI